MAQKTNPSLWRFKTPQWQLKTPRTLAMVSITLLSLVGVVEILYGTRWGPIVFSDAAGYIGAARNLIAGRGLGNYEASGRFNLLSSNPPLYPLILAAFAKLGFDLLEAIRWFNALLFGATILLSGLLLYFTTRSASIAISTSAVLLTPLLVLKNYMPAQSEPLFISASLAGILLLLVYLEKGKWFFLFWAAMAFSLVVATRYAGIILPAAGALCLLVLARSPQGSAPVWKRRWIDAVTFGVLSNIPLVIWVIWLQTQPKAEPIRQLQFTAGELWKSLADFRLALVELLWPWLPFVSALPPIHYRYKLILLILLLGILIGLLALAYWKVRKQSVGDEVALAVMRLIGLAAIFCLSYLGTILLSYLTTLPRHGLPERYLLLIQIMGVFTFFAVCGMFIRAWPAQKWLRALPVAGALVFVIAYLPASLSLVSQYHADGAGFTSQRWRESAVIQAITELPAGVAVISNEADAVRFLTGRPCYRINEITFLEPQPVDLKYGDFLDDPNQKVFREEGAALILFDTLYWQLDPVYGAQTSERLAGISKGLSVYGEYWDGTIYFYLNR